MSQFLPGLQAEHNIGPVSEESERSAEVLGWLAFKLARPINRQPTTEARNRTEGVRPDLRKLALSGSDVMGNHPR